MRVLQALGCPGKFMDEVLASDAVAQYWAAPTRSRVDALHDMRGKVSPQQQPEREPEHRTMGHALRAAPGTWRYDASQDQVAVQCGMQPPRQSCSESGLPQAPLPAELQALLLHAPPPADLRLLPHTPQPQYHSESELESTSDDVEPEPWSELQSQPQPQQLPELAVQLRSRPAGQSSAQPSSPQRSSPQLLWLQRAPRTGLHRPRPQPAASAAAGSAPAPAPALLPLPVWALQQRPDLQLAAPTAGAGSAPAQAPQLLSEAAEWRADSPPAASWATMQPSPALPRARVSSRSRKLQLAVRCALCSIPVHRAEACTAACRAMGLATSTAPELQPLAAPLRLSARPVLANHRCERCFVHVLALLLCWS